MERMPISIYMLKPVLITQSFDDVFSAAFDSDGLASGQMDFGEDIVARFWVGQGPQSSPEWVRRFAPIAGLNPDNFKSASVQGAIGIRLREQAFLLSFGHAWRRVRGPAIVQNFGLRCVLNLCGESDLRALKHDRISHDYVQTMVQSPEQASIYRFGFDIEQDLLRGVRAVIKESLGFGATINGSDSLKISYAPTKTALPELLKSLQKIHAGELYKKTFGWIDDISPVRDESLLGYLVGRLASEVNSGGNGLTLCLPDFEGWDSYDRYIFGRVDISSAASSLSLSSWLHYARGAHIINIDADTLIRQKVTALCSANTSIRRSWPVMDCLHGVIDTPKGRYLVHGGDWFQLGDGFVGRIENQLRTIVKDYTSNQLPAARLGEHEGVYNSRVASASKRKLKLLDRKMIMHGGGMSKVEVCDLLSTSLQLFCVKRWSSASAVSHLCQQALVSCRLIRGDIPYSKKVERKLKGEHRAAWLKIRSSRVEPEVVFVLMGGVAVNQLPLFSRITLLDASKQLRGLGFSVAYASV